MEVSKERWLQAQDEEIKYHQGNNFQPEEFTHSSFTHIANMLNVDWKTSFQNKSIIEIGPAACPFLIECQGNFKKGIIVEPLFDRFPVDVQNNIKNNKIEVITDPFEESKNIKVDEIWLFNVIQHVICPDKFIQKAKKQAKTIRIFEGLATYTDVAHPHPVTLELLESHFGEGNLYKGGSIKGFHQADCYYKTWNKGN